MVEIGLAHLPLALFLWQLQPVGGSTDAWAWLGLCVCSVAAVTANCAVGRGSVGLGSRNCCPNSDCGSRQSHFRLSPGLVPVTVPVSDPVTTSVMVSQPLTQSPSQSCHSLYHSVCHSSCQPHSLRHSFRYSVYHSPDAISVTASDTAHWIPVQLLPQPL